MKRVEAQKALMDGKIIDHETDFKSSIIMKNGLVVTISGSLAGTLMNPFHQDAPYDGYFIYEEPKKEPKKEAGLKRIEVGNDCGFLLAGNLSLYTWPSRAEFVGFEYDKSSLLQSAPLMYTDGKVYAGDLCLTITAGLKALNNGDMKEVRPIAVWVREGVE